MKSIFDRAAREIGDVPIVVANDGDVTALAGAMSMERGCVMGLAMGTSEAVGYVNADGNLLGWFNELAAKITVMLPDEKTRRVGQSVAAASLPEVIK